MVSRIATFPATNSLINANLATQAKVSATQLQISSGLKSPDYKGIARDSQRLLNLEASQAKLEAYSTNGKLIEGNNNLTFNAIQKMMDLGNYLLQALTAAASGNYVDPSVTVSQANIIMQEFAGLLNTESGGRYVFAGSMIDTPPVDLADPAWTAQTPPSVANTSYYQGDDVILAVQVSETLSINYGITANNTAFEQALRALNLVVNNPGSVAANQEAQTLMQSAIEDMANLRGQTSTNARAIENANLRNDEDIATLAQTISNLKEVDLPAATVKLSSLTTQLEASYATTTRILDLNLFSFLR